jgi:hypothetical protein
MQEVQMITRLTLMIAFIALQAAAQYPPLFQYMMPWDAEIGLKSAAPATISDHGTVKMLTSDVGSTMIRIFAVLQTSLDGFIERAKREVDWVTANDGELWAETPVFNTSRF